MTAPELIQQLLVPILIAIGGLVVVIIGAVGAFIRRQDKVMDAMAARETARIESDANRTLATVEREKLFNGMVTALQENLNRVEAKYDKLDEDYRKEVQRGNAQEEIIRELHKQVTELPFLRDKVNILQKQIEGIQESRAQREIELKAANDRADLSEAKLEAATVEWAEERDRLNVRIVELSTEVERLNQRLKGVEQDIRATPVQDIPAVPPDTNGEAAA